MNADPLIFLSYFTLLGRPRLRSEINLCGMVEDGAPQYLVEFVRQRISDRPFLDGGFHGPPADGH